MVNRSCWRRISRARSFRRARLGRAPLSLLATHTRLEPATLQDALERIIALGFATSEEVDDERTYSALSQHAG